MKVEPLQVLVFGPQVPEGVLHPRVEVHLHGLHNLPWREARCHQGRRVLLQHRELRRELDSAAHVVEAVSDPQIRVRLHMCHRGDRDVGELELEVVGFNRTVVVAPHTHATAFRRVSRHARP